MSEQYEFVMGTPEQVEVFLDLQRMIVRLYNMWPGDVAIAVFAGSLGCVTAMIETQYKMHLEECEHCKREFDPTIDLRSVAEENFKHYYAMEHEQALRNQMTASDMVDKFFKGGKHGLE